MIDLLDSMAGSGNSILTISGVVASVLYSKFGRKKDKKDRVKEFKKEEKYKNELSHKIGNELNSFKSVLYENGLVVIDKSLETKFRVVLKHYPLSLPKEKAFAPFHDALKVGFKVCKQELLRTFVYEDVYNQTIDQLHSRISDLAVTIQDIYLTTIRKECGKSDIYEQAMEALTIVRVYKAIEKLYRFVLRHQNKKMFDEWEGTNPIPNNANIASRINANRVQDADKPESVDGTKPTD